MVADHQGKPPTLVLVDNEYNLFLDPTSAKGTTVFTVHFQNVQMQSYFVKEKITASGLEVLLSGRAEGCDV
jgi:hypothetical protein